MGFNLKTVGIVLAIILVLILLKSLIKLAFWAAILLGIAYLVWRFFLKGDEEPEKKGYPDLD